MRHHIKQYSLNTLLIIVGDVLHKLDDVIVFGDRSLVLVPPGTDVNCTRRMVSKSQDPTPVQMTSQLCQTAQFRKKMRSASQIF